MRSDTILVTGITGRQGGAVADRLLADGWRVRGLTRNAASPAARALAARGVDLVEASLDDPAALRRAVAGAYGVYSVQDFWQTGFAREVRQGCAIADAAADAGVRHFVYGSVGAAERTVGLGITHFDSKARIERHLAGLAMPTTIFRPVTFFENFSTPRVARAAIERGVFRFLFPAGRPFQMVAAADIGAFVGMAFAQPDYYVGKAIELASDVVTMEDFAAALGDAVGRDVVFREIPLLQTAILMRLVQWLGKTPEYKVGPSITAHARWSYASPTGGWNADMGLMRALHPGLIDTRRWVRSIDWRGLAAAAR